jgi:hypothetical protein
MRLGRTYAHEKAILPLKGFGIGIGIAFAIAIAIGFCGLARPTAIATTTPTPIPTFWVFSVYFRSRLLYPVHPEAPLNKNCEKSAVPIGTSTA